MVGLRDFLKISESGTQKKFGIELVHVYITGYGIFTSQEIEENSFIAEYKGDLISVSSGEKRDDLYQELQDEGKEVGNFLYFFDKYW